MTWPWVIRGVFTICSISYFWGPNYVQTSWHTFASKARPIAWWPRHTPNIGRGWDRSRSRANPISYSVSLIGRYIGGYGLTYGLSGLPGPGDKITQSILGRMFDLNSFLPISLVASDVSQMSSPGISIMLNDYYFLQYLFIRIELCE